MTGLVAQCGETRFPSICGTCGEPERAMGTRKRPWVQCGCPERQQAPERDRAMRRQSTRAKGDRGEKRIAKAMGAKFQPNSGAFATASGSLSKAGDLRAVENETAFKIEVKNSEFPIASVVAALGACDAIVVNHKREPFVFCRLRTWRETGRQIVRREG